MRHELERTRAAEQRRGGIAHRRRLRHHDPPARCELLGDACRGVRAEDRGGADARGGGGGQGLTGTLRACLEAVAIQEHQHERGPGTGRGQVAVEERLQVAGSGRDPGGLLDLEDELPGRDPVHAGRDDQQVLRRRDAGADDRVRTMAVGAGGVRSLDPVDQAGGIGIGLRDPAGEQVGRDRRGDDRGHVAHGVAPAAVHLDRGEDEVRYVRDGGARAGRDGRRPSATVTGCLHRGDRRRRPALVAAADDEAVGQGIQGQLERLRRDGAPAGQAGAAPAIAEEGGSRERGVLRGSAAGRQDGAVTERGVTNRGRKGVRRPVGEDPPGDAGGQGGLGGDHLGHRPGRAVPQRGHREVVPGLGGGGQGGVGIEGAERSAQVVHARMLRLRHPANGLRPWGRDRRAVRRVHRSGLDRPASAPFVTPGHHVPPCEARNHPERPVARRSMTLRHSSRPEGRPGDRNGGN